MRVKFLIFIGLAIFASGCSSYQAVLKSNEVEYKYKKALIYYATGDYYRATPLLEELLPIYRGTPEGEELFYLYAYGYYHSRDYLMAGYYFRNYAQTYVNSPYSEEAAFKGAYCYYLDSPRPSLDQENTVRAISELDIFKSRYPQSRYVAECDSLIARLQEKLAQKAFNNAMLYFDLENYKSAIVAFENCLEDFPASENREITLYYLVKSNYLLAVNSVENKQIERYKATLEECRQFENAFTTSQYAKEVEKMKQHCELALSGIQEKTQTI